MIALCDRYVDGAREAVAAAGWSVAQLGARAEIAFSPDPPRTGGESAALHEAALEDALRLFLLNRGVLMTPFHTMCLMSPATTEADVDRLTAVLGEAVSALSGA